MFFRVRKRMVTLEFQNSKILTPFVTSRTPIFTQNGPKITIKLNTWVPLVVESWLTPHLKQKRHGTIVFYLLKAHQANRKALKLRFLIFKLNLGLIWAKIHRKKK